MGKKALTKTAPAVETEQKIETPSQPKMYFFDGAKVGSLADVQIFIQLCRLTMSEKGYNQASDVVKHYFTEIKN